MPSDVFPGLILMRGSRGQAVARLKRQLSTRPDILPVDLQLDETPYFDSDTETALRNWQARSGLVADGIAGPRTMQGLMVDRVPLPAVSLSATAISAFYPNAKTSTIAHHLPYITAALGAFGLPHPETFCLALAIIRVGSDGFAPIAEQPSHLNTTAGQASFSSYENRRSLGNTRTGDGALFRGRGYTRLTGKKNYLHYGSMLEIPLAANPESACAPEVAACLLAAFLTIHGKQIKAALSAKDVSSLRKLFPGTTTSSMHCFRETIERASHLLALPARSAAISSPPGPAEQRDTLNVQPDPADLRDRPYTPPPVSLPATFPADTTLRECIGAYNQAGLILNQGREGACTGFGLACVINYLRWRARQMPDNLESVSPRMLYHFARRYDEYEGENYEGSSCRGALKGWYHNGVCLESHWPYRPGDERSLPAGGWDSHAAEHTLGVYYRVQVKAITDVQAAIHEVGAIYVSAYTHTGWETVGNTASPPTSHLGLPVIPYDGSVSRKGGHAFALVGYNRKGFVIQNSWGKRWGAAGFAVITYEDWLMHAMDAWVAAMGVPGVISGRLASTTAPITSTVSSPATDSWWDETTAYRHSIVLGNNGKVNRFDQVDGLTRTLQNQACVLPDNWFRTTGQQQKRVVLYAHGGLNSEKSAIDRARAMGRYFLGNGCYPLFLVWKTGLLESIAGIITDMFASQADERARGAGKWLSDNLTDPLIEKTIGRPFARPLWSEMKENAALAAETGRGGDLLITALKSLAQTWGKQFELHLVGHSAGSIILGWLLESLGRRGLIGQVASLHLYAPACTVSFANRYFAPYGSLMKNLFIDILSDGREQDDHVAQIYRKSLLYLVSNGLEPDSRTPLMGLHNVYTPAYSGWDGSSRTAETLAAWQHAVAINRVDKRLTIHNRETFVTRLPDSKGNRGITAKASHGGFDNDVEVIGKTLQHITGGNPLVLPVDDLSGF